MIRPDSDGIPFVARWNSLIRSLLVESSVKLVARTAADYADFKHGTDCRPGNPRLARDTGLSERTIRTAWAVLRGMNLAARVYQGSPSSGEADEYALQIPDDWKGKPLLGPKGHAFRCLHCGKKTNPRGNCTVNADKGDAPDTVRFKVHEFAFCPTPRKGDGCFDLWNKDQIEAGAPVWSDRGQDVWALFRLSRGDDW